MPITHKRPARKSRIDGPGTLARLTLGNRQIENRLIWSTIGILCSCILILLSSIKFQVVYLDHISYATEGIIALMLGLFILLLCTQWSYSSKRPFALMPASANTTLALARLNMPRINRYTFLLRSYGILLLLAATGLATCIYTGNNSALKVLFPLNVLLYYLGIRLLGAFLHCKRIINYLRIKLGNIKYHAE